VNLNPAKLLSLLPHDKALHVVGGTCVYVGVLSAQLLRYKLTGELPFFDEVVFAHYVAYVTGVAAAVINELVQRWRNKTSGKGHGIEPWDAFATSVGVALPAAPVQVLFWLARS
jgi:hypothetical protein